MEIVGFALPIIKKSQVVGGYPFQKNVTLCKLHFDAGRLYAIKKNGKIKKGDC